MFIFIDCTVITQWEEEIFFFSATSKKRKKKKGQFMYIIMIRSFERIPRTYFIDSNDLLGTVVYNCHKHYILSLYVCIRTSIFFFMYL